MMERRWKIVFSIGTAILALAFLTRLIRFYRVWYDTPVTLNKIFTASLGYVKGDWPNLLFGALLLAAMAANWAIARKRATGLK
jgi:hypothetical protein